MDGPMAGRWRTAARFLAFSLLVPVMAAASPARAADPSLRPVPITTPAGELGALLAPVPVIITDAANPHGVMRLDNISTLAERFTISVDDYLLDAEGRASPAPPDYAFGSAAWYRFTPTTFTLPPGTSRDVTFTVDVPPGAPAGDHLAAVSVTVEAAEPGATGDVRSVLVLENRLQHRIPGARPEAPQLTLAADPSTGAVDFTGRIVNDGNTVLAYQTDPRATIELRSTVPWAGSDPERTLVLASFYVGPAAERVVRHTWTDPPLIGFYRATLVLPGTGSVPTSSADTEFVVVNWPVLAVLGAVLAAVGLVVLTRRRRARA